MSVLVNNAGVVASFGRPPLEADVEDWDTMLAVNLAAPMRLVRLLGPGMVGERDPVILNISSISGVDPVPNSAGYATSKWGLTGCAGLLAASPSGLLAASLCMQSRPACCSSPLQCLLKSGQPSSGWCCAFPHALCMPMTIPAHFWMY